MQKCLPPRTLEALLAGELPAAERAAAEGHLSTCSACRESLVRALDAPPPDAEEVPEGLRRAARELVGPRRAGGRVWLPLAAALLVALGAAFFLRPQPTVRAPAGDVLREMPAHLTLELGRPLAGATVSAEPAVFRWQPLSSARRYDLMLVDEVGDVIFETRATEAFAEMPRSGVDVTPGATYYWSVRALLADGTVVESGVRPVSF